MNPITIADLAAELGVEQTSDQPYSPADVFAGLDPTLVEAHGTLDDGTVLTADEADGLRAVYELPTIIGNYVEAALGKDKDDAAALLALVPENRPGDPLVTRKIDRSTP